MQALIISINNTAKIQQSDWISRVHVHFLYEKDQACQEATGSIYWLSSPTALLLSLNCNRFLLADTASVRAAWSASPPCWKHSSYWSHSLSVTINSLHISLNWIAFRPPHDSSRQLSTKKEASFICHLLKLLFILTLLCSPSSYITLHQPPLLLSLSSA